MNYALNMNRFGITGLRARSEPELQAMVVRSFEASGIAVEVQVTCAAGVADLVTASRDAVVEIKLDLTRKQIQWAVGQVLLYRAAINPQARAIVVGYVTSETAELIGWAAELGVEIVVWTDGNEPGSETFASSSQLHPQPFGLGWNVQELARSHGITGPSELSRFLKLPRQGLYNIWRGTAASVSVLRLEQIARRLAPTPDIPLRVGDWFRWDNHGRLVWGIKEIAEQIGMDAAKLAFAADQYPQQFYLFWDGRAKFVFVDTLARLAAALETRERPFDVGDMFVKVWSEG